MLPSEIFFEPPYLSFNTIDKYQKLSRIITMVTSSDISIHVTKIEIDSKAFAVKRIDESDNNFQKITIETIPPLPEGRISANLIIHTNHPEYRREYVNIRANVFGELIVNPQKILLSKGMKSVTRNIYIKAGIVKEFKVLDLQVPQKKIKINTVYVNKGYCKITVSNLDASDDINGKYIKIITNVTQKREILIPIIVNPS